MLTKKQKETVSFPMVQQRDQKNLSPSKKRNRIPQLRQKTIR